MILRNQIQLYGYSVPAYGSFLEMVFGGSQNWSFFVDVINLWLFNRTITECLSMLKNWFQFHSLLNLFEHIVFVISNFVSWFNLLWMTIVVKVCTVIVIWSIEQWNRTMLYLKLYTRLSSVLPSPLGKTEVTYIWTFVLVLKDSILNLVGMMKNCILIFIL